MILYHFTSRERVPEIVASGALKPTDPVLRKRLPDDAATLAVRTDASQPLLADAVADWPDERIREAFGGPLVVHLTADHRDCSSVGAPPGVLMENKNDARFVVDVPRSDAYPWIRWARQHGIDAAWLRALRRGHRDAQDYYVVARPIPSSEWVEVTDMQTYDPLWPTG